MKSLYQKFHLPVILNFFVCLLSAGCGKIVMKADVGNSNGGGSNTVLGKCDFGATAGLCVDVTALDQNSTTLEEQCAVFDDTFSNIIYLLFNQSYLDQAEVDSFGVNGLGSDPSVKLTSTLTVSASCNSVGVANTCIVDGSLYRFYADKTPDAHASDFCDQLVGTLQ